jgi:hypothetical protein
MDISNNASQHNDKADSQNRIISHKFDPKDNSPVPAADIHVNDQDQHDEEGDEIRQAHGRVNYKDTESYMSAFLYN